MNWKILLLLLIFAPQYLLFAQTGKNYTLISPDGKITITINTGKVVSWSVMHDATPVILPSEISVTLDDGYVLGKNTSVKKAVNAQADETFSTPFYKKASVHNNYDQL